MFLRWRTIKAFPKLVLVVTVLVGSTVLFLFWWYFRFSRTHSDSVQRRAEAAAAMKLTAATLPNRVDRLFLADGDLYDAESGNLVFKKWLRGDRPAPLFYDSAAQKIYGQVERGMNSYSLEGTLEKHFVERHGVAFSKDFKEAFFARNRDLWRSEVDWSSFQLVNERQVTKVGNLQESFMLHNILLASDHFIVLRNGDKTLHINLSTGEVSQTRLPLGELRGGRSPDRGVLMGYTVGRTGRQVFAYDVEKNDVTVERVAGRRAAVNDFAWANQDHCIVLVGADTVMSYDRKQNAFSTLCSLPVACRRLGSPSPDGRFIFAYTNKAIVLVDTKEKQAESFESVGQQLEWIDPNTMLIANDVPDSEARGIWFRKVGEEPVRILPEPYLVSKDDVSAVLVMREPRWVIFATRTALFRLDTNGEGLKELVQVAKPTMRLQAISEWPLSAQTGAGF